MKAQISFDICAIWSGSSLFIDVTYSIHWFCKQCMLWSDCTNGQPGLGICWPFSHVELDIKHDTVVISVYKLWYPSLQLKKMNTPIDFLPFCTMETTWLPVQLICSPIPFWKGFSVKENVLFSFQSRPHSEGRQNNFERSCLPWRSIMQCNLKFLL